MSNLFNDIIGFLKTLNYVDLIFFFAVILLIVLIISLIYFLRVNEDVFEEETKEDFYDDEKDALIDLKTITKEIEKKEKTTNVELTKYEDEQEEKAIISYDELLKKCKQNNIKYEREEVVDDLIIKKVSLSPKENDYSVLEEIDEDKSFVSEKIFSYEKEEAFLEALKNLQLGLGV